MFLLICKLYICIQNVFGHIFYSSRLHLYWQFWQFEVQKLAYMLILAAGGSSPYLSSVGGVPPNSAKEKNLLFRSKNSIFCLFLCIFSPFWTIIWPFWPIFNLI